jgi:hypothetical protein
VVTCPQAHARRSARCSHTHSRTSGRSKTCRASTPTTSANVRSPPQPPHRSGRCTTTSSGSATWARSAPGAPGCLPGARPPLPPRRCCRGAGGLPSPSDDGGRDELEESLPRRRSSSATRAASAALAAASLALASRSWSITIAWTATVASRSRSGEEITASWTTSGHARLPNVEAARGIVALRATQRDRRARLPVGHPGPLHRRGWTVKPPVDRGSGCPARSPR